MTVARYRPRLEAGTNAPRKASLPPWPVVAIVLAMVLAMFECNVEFVMIIRDENPVQASCVFKLSRPARTDAILRVRLYRRKYKFPGDP